MNRNLCDTPCFMGDDGRCAPGHDNGYEVVKDTTCFVATFNLPAILLPVAAPNAKVSMIADAGTPSVYVRVWRKA